MLKKPIMSAELPYIFGYTVSRKILDVFLEHFFSIRLIRGQNLLESKTLKNRLFLHFEDFKGCKRAFKILEYWTFFQFDFYASYLPSPI
jgi:hypothetical protein